MRRSVNYVFPFLIVFATFFVVRRIPFPLGGRMFLMFLVGVTLMFWVAKLESRNRRLILQNGATQLGFQPVDSSEVNLSIYPLRGLGWVEGAACGELQGLKAWIFDYCKREPGETYRNLRQTVAAFRVEEANLPIFQIRLLGLATCGNRSWKNRDWENSDERVYFPDAPNFHQRFELMSNAEEGVRRHFDAKLLETIAVLDDGNYVVQGYHTTVLFFAPGRMLSPDEYEAFARKGADIAYALFSAEKRMMAAISK